MKKAKDFVKNYKWLVPVMLAVALLAAPVANTFAQTATLDLDANTMTTNLFQGANIIIVALGAVMFLLAGFKLGTALLHGILNIVGNIRIG